jgi:hypothetical protein
VCRPKHVEQLRNSGIINSTTQSHLVCSFYEIYITMDGFMNINFYKRQCPLAYSKNLHSLCSLLCTKQSSFVDIPNHTSTVHTLPLFSILILICYLSLDLPSVFFPSVPPPTKIIYLFIFSHISTAYPVPLKICFLYIKYKNIFLITIFRFVCRK